MEALKLQWIALACLIPFVMYYELKENKIFNILTVPAIALGLLLGFLEGRFSYYLWGMLVAGGIFFLPYMISGLTRPRPVIGGGDVKLGAAIGALMGPLFSLYTIYYAVFLAVGYWLVTLAIRFATGKARKPAKPAQEKAGDGEKSETPKVALLMGRIPFGTAMCTGVFCVFWLRPYVVPGFAGW